MVLTTHLRLQLMIRIYHTWEKWECYPAGFYETSGPYDDEKCRDLYAEFLRDIFQFQFGMARVLAEWPRSCEHYLSNENMNRLAWLGQSAMCIVHKVPAQFRGGFVRLTSEEQLAANVAALDVLNMWLLIRGEPALTLETAQSKTEANLY